MAEVQAAILNACNQRGWAGRIEGEGVIGASILVRRYTVAVEIHYTEDVLTILYRDSTGLNHLGNTIHRNYNHWVATLHRTILRNLGSRAQNY
jgi:hypothetical protein